MTQVRYLLGIHAGNTAEHIIIQEQDGKRFPWCQPTADVSRITQLVATLDAVTCPLCHNGSLMWLLDRRH